MNNLAEEHRAKALGAACEMTMVRAGCISVARGFAARLSTSSGKLVLHPAASSPGGGRAVEVTHSGVHPGDKGASSSSGAETAPASSTSAVAGTACHQQATRGVANWQSGPGAAPPPAFQQLPGMPPAFGSSSSSLLPASNPISAFQPFAGQLQSFVPPCQAARKSPLSSASGGGTQVQPIMPARVGQPEHTHFSTLPACMLPLEAASAAAEALRQALVAQEHFRHEAVADMQARVAAPTFAKFLLCATAIEQPFAEMLAALGEQSAPVPEAPAATATKQAA